MRRRERVDPNGPPPSLLTFDAADWPDYDDPMMAFRAWEAARKAWQAVHGWPTDALAELRERYNTRRVLGGRLLIDYDRHFRDAEGA